MVELVEFHLGCWLGHQVGYVVACSDVGNVDQTFAEFLPDKVVFDVDVFCLLVVHRVLD